MKYLLFIMFFTAPPAQPGKQVWTFSQSTQAEFLTMDACKKFGTHVQQRLNTTATVTMRGWCTNLDTGDGTFALHGALPACDDSNKDCYEFPVKLGH